MDATQEEPVDNQNSLLKVILKDRKKIENDSKFKNKRHEEIKELQRLQNSKTTIQIAVILTKDIKIEFTSSAKESFGTIYQ